MAELSNQFKELDKAFEQNLARIYTRGGHKSGVEGCQKLIADNCQSSEVVGIFLRALCNKNLLQVAKSASSGSFKFLEFHASLFGYMARMFKTNFKDTLRDIPPAVSKTVKKVIQAMKDMFFQETHDNIRNALSISFQEILDYCFPPTRTYGKSQLSAKDLIFDPLFEELQAGRDRVSRQTACYILRRLNEIYMSDANIVSVQHC